MSKDTKQILSEYDRHVITSCVKKLEPIVIAQGDGAIVKDIEGKSYIDCWSGISVVNTGHCNPKVVKAIQEQASKLIHCCAYVYPTVPVMELAKKLASISPGNLSKSFFGNSGAESIECALKLGKKFTKKHEIIALTHSFHGRTLGTLSVTGMANRRRYDMGPYLSGVSFAPSPYCYRCPLGLTYPECGVQCAKMLEDVTQFASSGDIAEFIAEPIQCEGGIIVPPKEYFKEVKKILDKHSILFIDDEVQTGFGRTGKMFGIEHYGVQPDIVCMAKAIAGGMPLGACTTNDEIGNSFEAGDHLSTFGGNPVACAAALANIEFIQEERIVEKTVEKGEYLGKRLLELKDEHELIGDVRGTGLLWGLELVKDQKNKIPATSETTEIRDKCRESGVLIGHGGSLGSVLRIQPPLVISTQLLDQVVEVLDKAFKNAAK